LSCARDLTLDYEFRHIVPPVFVSVKVSIMSI
jgi:hypothetical protein